MAKRLPRGSRQKPNSREGIRVFMKALVTGATGFLGLYIVEQLRARGDNVRAFCRRAIPELARLNVEITLGDCKTATLFTVHVRISTLFFILRVLPGFGDLGSTFMASIPRGHFM